MSRRLLPVSFRRKYGFLLIACSLLAQSIGLTALAQQPQPPQPRITQPVDERSLVALESNISLTAHTGEDRGAVATSLPAERLLLILRRSPSQQAALQSYLRAVQDSASPQYRRFLTPEEFGLLYGAADQDLGTIQAWLQTHGLTVAKVSPGRTAIEFAGTVGQIEQTFHTSIHQYSHDGVTHWANVSAPMVPAALAPVVAGVASLHDIKLRSQAIPGPVGRWDSARRRFVPSLTVAVQGQDYLFITPGDAATIYDAPNALNRSFPAGQTVMDGTGVTIGVAEDSQPDLTGLLSYQNQFGLPERGVNVVVDGDPESPEFASADVTEAVLDVEVAQGLAPGAQINLYTAANTVFQPGVLLAALRAIDDNAINILSVSFSDCEADLGNAGNLEISNAWEQAAAQGITVIVSSGDSGSAGCDDPDTQTAAANGLAVSGLASTPFNIAVGGTDFDTLGTAFSTYVSASSLANGTSALGYIPEYAWNDSVKTSGLLASNTAFTDSTGHTNIFAGSGGASNGVYSKPAWQAGFTASNGDLLRDLPDVSLFSGAGGRQAVWAVCESGDCQGSNGTIHGVGGTSAAAPAFAGMLAMVNQKIGASNRMGQANWVLYQLAQTTPSIFHAIAASNNAVVCSAGSPDCSANGFLTGYNVATGYSLATGLGSVDVTSLVSAWGGDARAATTTTLTLDKTSFVHGTLVNLTAAVTPSATGYVAVVNTAGVQPGAQNSSPGLTLALNAGAAAGSTTQFPGGHYSVFSTYGGDATHTGSTSPAVAMSVTAEDSVLNFSINSIGSTGQQTSAAGATVPLGTLLSMRAFPLGVSQAASANPIADAAGSVDFIDNNAAGYSSCHNQVNLGAAGAAEFDIQTCSPGDHSITATYSGDLSYNPSTAAPINFTVAKGAVSVALSAPADSITFGNLLLTANLTPGAYGGLVLYPSGPVTFTDMTSNAVLSTATASATCSGTPAVCTAGMNLYPQQLLPGANVIVATFDGDPNYNPSTPSAPLTITCAANCTNSAGQTLQISFYAPSQRVFDPGDAGTASVEVDSTGKFNGNVNMTCSVTGTRASDVHLPTCSFTPASIAVADQQAATTTVTIKTTGSASGMLAPAAVSPRGRGIGALACMVIFAMSAGRRRRWSSLAAFLLFFAALGVIEGCGGGGASGGSSTTSPSGGSGSNSSATTADTYTVTLHAADAATGTLTAADYFTITVE